MIRMRAFLLPDRGHGTVGALAHPCCELSRSAAIRPPYVRPGPRRGASLMGRRTCILLALDSGHTDVALSSPCTPHTTVCCPQPLFSTLLVCLVRPSGAPLRGRSLPGGAGGSTQAICPCTTERGVLSHRARLPLTFATVVGASRRPRGEGVRPSGPEPGVSCPSRRATFAWPPLREAQPALTSGAGGHHTSTPTKRATRILPGGGAEGVVPHTVAIAYHSVRSS